MARQSFISHAVNGYSRYDVPESKAFTCTPGILYPVRIDFINARDRVTIAQGIDVRSNPLAVPSFNPYTVRLHRFWVPLQLYHPEMRTNSSKFDMNNVSLNWIPARLPLDSSLAFGLRHAYSNSLLFWLRITGKDLNTSSFTPLSDVSLGSSAPAFSWANADTYLAYWDIVRNYYSYSQWSIYSFAWPGSWALYGATLPTPGSPAGSLSVVPNYSPDASYFYQRYGNLEFLDAYFESQFYPSALASSNNTYNRSSLWYQILFSDILTLGSAASDGFPVSTGLVSTTAMGQAAPSSQFSTSSDSKTPLSSAQYFLYSHPMAVVPSNPDRFSRLLPAGVSSSVSMSGVNTIPQLAIASRLQEYKDLLGAGGNRYSDWLETFFASKIEHVDRPKLLFSASQTVNVQVIMNQAGTSNFASNFNGDGQGNPLGQQGGSIAFNTQLGRSQSYYFREPGYMIDMLSIRPVYFWAGITPDYLNYNGADYFNPIYNDIGYQGVPAGLFYGGQITSATLELAQEPCFNEFRSSYDEVLGQISVVNGPVSVGDNGARPLYSYWLQQRSLSFTGINVASAKSAYYPALFVDISQVNSPFASNVEDNFFVNMSYSVRKKSLVNKTFATRLSNR
nr:MAG TPA: Major capsid protein [Microviridae sp.]